MSLLLDALKRAESQKKRARDAADGVTGRIPDIDFTAADAASIERSSAQNLFRAKHSGYNNYDKAKLIAALGGTALLLGAAGFYAWYWYRTSFPAASQISLNSAALPSPTTGAQTVPAINPATQNRPTPPPAAQGQAPSLSDVPAATVTPAPMPDQTALPATAANKNSKSALAAMPMAKAANPNKDLLALKPKPQPAARPSVSTPAAVVAKTPVSSPMPAVPVTSAPVVPSSNADNTIRLRRSNEEIFAINPDLGAAYQALTSGRLMEARQKYEMVLQKDPTNVDAELGLATIAAKNNEPAEAAKRYKRVLELNPKNPYALAGNAALVNDLPQTENQLRAQVAQQPQSAPLAAAMGNIFASQGRWNEAQQAYFDAVRLDANHPDYVFNLAVSLDQIGQPKLALENYQKALTLANVRPSQFSKETLATRIAELSRNK